MPYPNDWRVPLDEDKNVLGMLRPFVDNADAISGYIDTLEQDRAIACMAYITRDEHKSYYIMKGNNLTPFDRLISKHAKRLMEITNEEYHKQAAADRAEREERQRARDKWRDFTQKG